MEHCHVVDEEDVAVPVNEDNIFSVSGGDDNEAINHFGQGTVNHMQITRHTDGLFAEVIGSVPHDPDQHEEALAEDICAAEVVGGQEQQVPVPEGQPEQQIPVAPEAIEPTLGAQILDALRELRADFV